MSAPDNRRDHPRIPTKLTVQFANAKAFVRQYAENISHGGLFVRTDKPLPRDSKIRIVLQLPETQQKLELEARVVHIPIGSDGLPTGMGMQFLNLSDQNREMLKALMDALQKKHPELTQTAGRSPGAALRV